MSSFKTEIPVPLDKVATLLPAGSTIEKTEWDAAKGCVVLRWRNRSFQTKVDFPTPFSIEQLEAKKVPKGVDRGPTHMVMLSKDHPLTKHFEDERVRLSQQKVLTQSDLSTKSQLRAKASGKAKNSPGIKPKGSAKHPAAAAPAVDGSGSGPVERVSS